MYGRREAPRQHPRKYVLFLHRHSFPFPQDAPQDANKGSLPPTELRKKVWINQGDIILLSLRDYQDNKGDVILKYTADEARSLKAYGELPENAKINETDTYGAEGDGDCNFEFDEDRDSESEEETGGVGAKDIAIDDI